MGTSVAFVLSLRGGHNRRMPKGFISVKQTAERLGKSEQAVRNLCQRGRITAEQFAGVWIIDEAALANFKETPRGKHITKP